MAAAVVRGSLEDPLPVREDQVAGQQDAATFVTMGQQCEENLHFLPALLNVADVIDYESLEAIQFLELLLQSQIDFGPQQSLVPAGRR